MIGDGQAGVDWLTSRMDAADEAKAKTNGHVKPSQNSDSVSSPLDDEAIIERCRAAKNAAKFEALFDHGDVDTYHGGDDSAADLALLSILKFYTQDPTQLEALISTSALGQRDKWRRRRDYRTRTIEKAISDVGETYQGREKSRPLTSSSSDTPIPSSDDEVSNDAKIVWFAELGEPKEREYLIEKIGVKGYPIVAFGAGGVAKSFAMLSAGIAIASASGVDDWLGLRVLDHGHVLYLDFELDAEEQHRRVRDLCAGMGIMIPKKLAYLSGVGITPERAFQEALAFVDEYKAKAVIIDSMGLAMQGNMDKGAEVLAFHGRYINPLRRAGATPFIVDHEGKLQTGERQKDKTPIGSAYKAWTSRSVLQFVFEEWREESSELDIRVRQTKTNFGPKIKPIGVRFTFEEKKVRVGGYELPDEELLEEESKPVKERILAALRLEGATKKQLQEATGASEGTVSNKLSELRGDGVITDNGRRPATYVLTSSSPLGTGGSSDDEVSKDYKPATVAGFFANPPDWLTSQLKVYRQDPARHFEPLCSAVAAVVLGDGARGDEVADEVRKVLKGEEGN